MPEEKTQTIAESHDFGALEPREARELADRAAAGDQEALQELNTSRRVLRALPYTIPQQVPPPVIKTRLLEELKRAETANLTRKSTEPGATIRAMPQRSFAHTLKRGLAWAAVFLLIALGLGYYNQRHMLAQLAQERNELQARAAEMQSAIEALELQLGLYARIHQSLQKSGVLLVHLGATSDKQSATAKVILDREQATGYFLASSLPLLQEDQHYQLWYIGKAGPIDAGVFQVDATGSAAVDVRNLPPNLAEISAFAVTREPKGGSRVPTLDQMLLLGKV